MAFVYEEPMLEKYKTIVYPLVETFNSATPTGCAIDHELDACMACFTLSVGEKDEEPDPGQYALFWRGEVIPFRAERNCENEVCTFVVQEIQLPDYLLDHKEKLHNMLREAMECFGRTFPLSENVLVEIQ